MYSVGLNKGVMPQITCAICRKEVDRIVVSEVLLEGVITVKAWCHGDTDSMQMTRAELDKIGKAGIDAIARDGGVAFATKRIAGSEHDAACSVQAALESAQALEWKGGKQ